MKSFLFPLLIGLCAPGLAMAANPLTPDERTVCRSLDHCLDIVDTHPPDSFDYKVLADEFRRFGTRGQRSLIRRISSEATSASNAADLIALTREKDALRALQAATGKKENRLLTRTIAALIQRLNTIPSDTKPLPLQQSKQPKSICRQGLPIPFEARRREMPFFELHMATPDAFGAYRPSATYNAPLEFATRGWLRSARPVPSGWIAAYPDGIIQYDNRTNAPSLRIKGNVLSVQAREPNVMRFETWAFILNAQNQTYIIDIGARQLRLATTLPGPLKELRRDTDGMLYASSDRGQSITLRPDGSIATGCGPK